MLLTLLKLGNNYRAITCGCIGCVLCKEFCIICSEEGRLFKITKSRGDDSVFPVDEHPFLTRQDKASSVPRLDLYASNYFLRLFRTAIHNSFTHLTDIY